MTEKVLHERLAEIVGPQHLLTGVERGPYVFEGRTPRAVVFPGSPEEVSQLVVLAAEEGIPVIPWGGGSKMALGAPPPEGGLVVGTRRLDRVVEHEPGDLTATVQAGTRMAALQAALGAKGQWFSLDPPLAAQATLGGVLAANASGPRRHLYGTARDLVIGIRVVGPDGAVVKGGGKVVKNVAGYDLTKLYVGSLGTLGIIVEATLKLRPRPEVDRAVVVGFAERGRAAAAVAALMASDLLPHSLELVEGGRPGLFEQTALARSEVGLLLGFDGIAEGVAWQLEEARRLCRDLGAETFEPLEGERQEAAWRFVRDFSRVAFDDAVAAARVGVLPAQVGGVLEQAAGLARGLGLRLGASAHAGHGILTLVLAPSGAMEENVSLAAVKALREFRELVRGFGGHLALEWAPLAIKEQVEVWDPPSPAVRIMQRIKAQLDPKGIMNPGRFVGGI